MITSVFMGDQWQAPDMWIYEIGSVDRRYRHVDGEGWNEITYRRYSEDRNIFENGIGPIGGEAFLLMMQECNAKFIGNPHHARLIEDDNKRKSMSAHEILVMDKFVSKIF